MPLRQKHWKSEANLILDVSRNRTKDSKKKERKTLNERMATMLTTTTTTTAMMMLVRMKRIATKNGSYQNDFFFVD